MRRKTDPQPIKALFPSTVRKIMAAHVGPSTPSKLPRVYLAGKIDKNDWRHDIVANLRGAWTDGEGMQTWPILPGAVLDGRADYTGPYFASCDHGCSHGQSAHASSGCSGDHVTFWETRNWAHSECLRAIAQSDLVFALLDTTDCYGTLFELGYAKALGKKIVVSTSGLDSDGAEDLWFTLEGAQSTYRLDPADVLAKELPEPIPTAQLDSEAERRVWEAYHQAKPAELAGLVTQHKVLRYRIDMALPERKIGFEIDGFAYHSDQETFVRDRKRHRELELAGWRIIRFSGKEACDAPRQVVADMARAAAAFIPKPTVAGDDL